MKDILRSTLSDVKAFVYSIPPNFLLTVTPKILFGVVGLNFSCGNFP